MKTFKFIPDFRLTILVLFQIASVSYGQINVVPFSSGNPSSEKEGMIYCLPRSVIKIQIEITKSESFKGPYADYAAKLLGITDIIDKNSVYYEFGNIELSSFAEIDPEQFFFIEMDDKDRDSRSLLIALSETGFISSFDEIPKIKREVRNTTSFGENSLETPKPFRDLLKPVLIEKVDTVIRRISIDTTTIEEKVLKRSVSEKTQDQQAREAADLIYRIEDNKFSLITGYQEVNYSRESLEFMLEQLNKMEKEYLALFKGYMRKTYLVYTYFVTPEAEKEGILETICRFSKTNGVSDKSGASGESVSLIVTPLKQNFAIEDFVKQRGQVIRKQHGLFYRIPEKTQVAVRVGGMLMAEKQMMVSQMGLVTFLPAKNISNVRFDAETGTITQAISE
ncbi:MAG: DUF4831 family protein [Bacteroidota bacterium]